MAYRYSNTDKWGDCWFSKLKPIEKLLFNYLCDNCDIAGFIELNQKRWASDIVTDTRTIEGALKGLGRGLTYSDTNDCLFIRNYLKHQKNLPLEPGKNPAHKGIIKRFELYAFKFSIKDINEFIEGASKGLPTPLGNGNGIGSDKGKEEKSVIPEFLEFKSYALENNPSVNLLALELKYKAWIENKWRDGNGKKIINWKSKILNTMPYLNEMKSIKSSPDEISYKELLSKFSKGETDVWEKYEPVTPGDKRSLWRIK